METLLLVIHVFICLLLVLVILIQPGKSPGMGGAFGGASSGNFGAKSPTTILTKITAVMAAFFMVSSLTLAWLSVRDHSARIELGDAHTERPRDISEDAPPLQESEITEEIQIVPDEKIPEQDSPAPVPDNGEAEDLILDDSEDDGDD